MAHLVYVHTNTDDQISDLQQEKKKKEKKTASITALFTHRINELFTYRTTREKEKDRKKRIESILIPSF